MNKYRWNVGEAHTAIAVPMIKQNRVKPSRTKLRKKLFRYYKRAKYGPRRTNNRPTVVHMSNGSRLVLTGPGGSFQGVDMATPSADFTAIYMGDFGALEEKMLMELSPHVPKDLTPEEREIWKRENFHLLYGTQSKPIGKLVKP